MPQYGSSKTTYCLDLSDEYIEIWTDILAKSLNGSARVQELDKLPVNITWSNRIDIFDKVVVSNETIKQVCVIYDEGYFILTGRKDTSNKWSILIGHIFDTTNYIKHQEMDKVIYNILRKLTIDESNESSDYFTNLTAWFQCVYPRTLKMLKKFHSVGNTPFRKQKRNIKNDCKESNPLKNDSPRSSFPVTWSEVIVLLSLLGIIFAFFFLHSGRAGFLQ